MAAPIGDNARAMRPWVIYGEVTQSEMTPACM
jgi:hypothetical protein